jgi:phosphoglucomutase
VLAKNNEGVPVGQLVSVETILRNFWKEFGRNYYSRYDFENCSTQKGKAVWDHLLAQLPKYVCNELFRAKGKSKAAASSTTTLLTNRSLKIRV